MTHIEDSATQEPVAWMHKQGNHEEPSLRQLDDWEIGNGWTQYPLYTHPPQRSEDIQQPKAAQEPVEFDQGAYDMIDRFLRNNLFDDDYEEFSHALDCLAVPHPQPKAEQEPSAFGVLFAVEESIRNGDCPWQIESAFDDYETARKLVNPQPKAEPKRLGTYEHKCPNVTGHRGPAFVCQKAGHGVSQDSYCNDCTCESAQPNAEQEPKREPLTDEQIVDTFCKAPHQTQHVAWFAAGVRYAEAAHGIGVEESGETTSTAQ